MPEQEARGGVRRRICGVGWKNKGRRVSRPPRAAMGSDACCLRKLVSRCLSRITGSAGACLQPVVAGYPRAGIAPDAPETLEHRAGHRPFPPAARSGPAPFGKGMIRIGILSYNVKGRSLALSNDSSGIKASFQSSRVASRACTCIAARNTCSVIWQSFTCCSQRVKFGFADTDRTFAAIKGAERQRLRYQGTH